MGAKVVLRHVRGEGARGENALKVLYADEDVASKEGRVDVVGLGGVVDLGGREPESTGANADPQPFLLGLLRSLLVGSL